MDELQQRADEINAANMTEDRAHDRAVAYAAERGEQDGRNAAGWYVQDTHAGQFGGWTVPE